MWHSKQNLGQNNYAHRNTCTESGFLRSPPKPRRGAAIPRINYPLLQSRITRDIENEPDKSRTNYYQSCFSTNASEISLRGAANFSMKFPRTNVPGEQKYLRDAMSRCICTANNENVRGRERAQHRDTRSVSTRRLFVRKVHRGKEHYDVLRRFAFFGCSRHVVADGCNPRP